MCWLIPNFCQPLILSDNVGKQLRWIYYVYFWGFSIVLILSSGDKVPLFASV